MLGILCGLESEATIARRIKGVNVAVSAAKPDKARQAVSELILKGSNRLLSFGLAAGLKPKLEAGSFIIGTSVYAPGRHWECDEAWVDELTRTFPKGWRANVWASETLIVKARDKQIVHDQSECYAADMESLAVAEAATQAGIPFAVLRVIADTADMDLPPAARVPLRDDGRINLGKILLNILIHPLQLYALLKLGQNTTKAMNALESAAIKLNKTRALTRKKKINH
jgi:adenosylhomocysteine nucleosidase